jgi:hypothetical protein
MNQSQLQENPRQGITQDFYRGLLASRQASPRCGDTPT